MERPVYPGISKYMLPFLVSALLSVPLASVFAQEGPEQPDSLSLPVEDSPPDTSWVFERSLISLPFGESLERDLYPGMIQLILREDIVKTGAQTLGELFAWVDGAQILDGGFLLDEQFVSLRGSLPQEVVFLIDGVRANEPSSGFFDPRDVPVECIYRVEILQGPMAGVIAGEATEAVVNLVTSRHPGGVPVSRISIVDGQGGLLIVKGSLSREIAGNGFLQLTAARTSLQGLIEEEPSKNEQLFSRFGVDIKGVDVEGWVRRTAVERENAADTTLGTHTRLTYGLTSKKRFGDGTIVSGTFSRTVHEFSGEFDFPIDEGSESGRTGFDVSVLKKNGEGQFVKTGFEWERLRAEYGQGTRDRVVRSSFYGNSLFRPLRSLYVAAGARADFYMDGKGAKVTGGLSIGYNGVKLLRPYISLSEGSYLYQSPGVDMMVDGRSSAVECGTVVTPHEKLTVKLLFLSRDQSTDNTTIVHEQPLETLGQAPSRDVFESSLRFTPLNTLYLGFAYSKTSFEDRWDSVFPSDNVLSLSAGFEKQLKGENLILEGSTIFRRLYGGEANILNVKAGVRIVDLVIFYQGVNLLDSRFEPLSGFEPHGSYTKWGFYWNFLD